MKVVLAAAGVALLAATAGGVASGHRVIRSCPASPVDGAQVHAGVITGGIDPFTDVVEGRFRLHAGELRDVKNGIFQKILWWAPANRRIGGVLVVRARTIYGPRRSFVQRFNRAYTNDTNDPKAYYPSTVVPPKAGCWRLRLRTGHLRNTLVVRVDPAG